MLTGSFQLPRAKRPLMGWVWVLVFHGLIFGVVYAGLSRDVVEKMPNVVQALLLIDASRDTPAPKPAAPPAPPAPPSPTPHTPKPAPKPAAPLQAAPPVPQAPAYELPATSTPVPALKGLTAAAPSAPPDPPATATAALSAASISTTTTNATTNTTTTMSTRTAAVMNVTLCEKPEYPSASRRLEEQGTVALRFLVGADGKVIQSEVEKSSGFKRLDEAARAGLSKCQFLPALVDGKPAKAWASMKYTWILE